MVSDSKSRYGSITRFLHWLMAAGFLFMLCSATARFIDKDAVFSKAIFAYHSQVGFTLLLLGVIRVVWALIQRSQRPENSAMARLGHFAMYALMLIVPTLAFLRSIGSGRAFVYWGVVPVLSASEEKIQWLVDMGNNWHGTLGWLLFLLIAGHIAMAVMHRLAGGDKDVFPRLIGK